jgi:hypothetical protein
MWLPVLVAAPAGAPWAAPGAAEAARTGGRGVR